MPLDLLPDTRVRFPVYCIHDPGLQADQCDFAEYIRTGNPRFLAHKPVPAGGVETAKWWCRALSWEEFEAVLHEVGGSEAMEDALCEVFRLTCKAVEHVFDEKKGKKLPFIIMEDERAGKVKRMSDISFSRVPRHWAIAIASVVFNKSGLAAKFQALVQRAVNEETGEVKTEATLTVEEQPEDEHRGNS